MKLIVISQSEQMTCVACEGTVTLLPVGQQRKSFEQLLGTSCFARTVLLDLSATDYLDSSGISWLILSHKHFREAGGRLVIHSVPPLLQRILKLLRLFSVLNLAADERAARELVAGPRS
jgi:anti-anti-sigma factor